MPLTAAQRELVPVHFEQGRQAYNQFIRNVGALQRAMEERQQILKRNLQNFNTIGATVHRLHVFPESLRGSEERKIATLHQRGMTGFQRSTQLQTEIRALKRRILNMVSPRFRQHLHAPYTNLALNEWSPRPLIAALELSAGNKLRRAGVKYMTGPRKGGVRLRENLRKAGLVSPGPRFSPKRSPTRKRPRSV